MKQQHISTPEVWLRSFLWAAGAFTLSLFNAGGHPFTAHCLLGALAAGIYAYFNYQDNSSGFPRTPAPAPEPQPEGK